MKKAIVIGILIPIIVYFIFGFIFVGVLGENVPQIASIGFGKLVTLLGIFTMLTSYFVLSFSLKDVFRLDLDMSDSLNFFLVSIVPILIYLVLYFIDFLDFVSILGIGGVISGGISAIMILFMCKKSKDKGNRKPEYEMPINWFIILFLSMIFIFGIVVELIL